MPEQAELKIDCLVAGYGQGVVIDELSLTVAPGEKLALLGRNGAGKSTLLKSVIGLVRARAGAILFGGERIDRLAPFEIARRGIGYTPQGREIFGDLTVEENLFLGDLTAKNAQEAYSLFPALAERRRQPAGRLSGGQQQQLAIARTLMGRPRLLLLDEPSEGIQPSIVEEITDILGRVARSSGMSLVLVEQNIDMALALADRVVFIERGKAGASVSTRNLRADRSLIDANLAL